MTPTELFEQNMNLVHFVLNQNFKRHAKDEDLQQEGYIALWNACLHYDPTVATFATFAHRCIKNKLINVLLKAQNEAKGRQCVQDEELLYAIVDPTDHYAILFVEPDIDVNTLISKLTQSQKITLQHLQEGLSARDIAKLKGISHQAVYSTISIIKEKIKKQLKEARCVT